MWVTRKGAIRARVNDLGIIPGSMGQKSYIVRGKGNRESFCSCSHGAGRAMSRGEAKRRFTLEDHAKAIDLIFHKAEMGKTYNIGGHNEWKNIDLIHLLCRIMDKKLNRNAGASASLIRFVKDRAGHDLRYAIDATQIQQELGWTPSLTFETGLEQTVDWYLANTEWLSQVTSGTYLKYYEQQYHRR